MDKQIKNTLIDILSKQLNYDICIDNPLLNVEVPKDNSNGDYTTTIAMRLAKELHKAPVEIANVIKTGLEASNLPIEKVIIAGPGFINLFIKNDALANCINHILDEDTKYGYNTSGNKEKILVEYVSANPTGDLHVGHAKAAAWGDSVTRLLNMSGYDCVREYYINDAGVQIDHLAESIYARYMQALGNDYPMPEDGYHGNDIITIGKEVAKKEGNKWKNSSKEEWIEHFKQLGIDVELGKIKEILKEFRVEFDVWSSEKAVRNTGKVEQTIDYLKKTGHVFEQDGAVWLKTTDFGDDKDRVLVKSDGLYTYLTPDIAYHLTKLERGYNHLVDLLGADHHGYISRMKAALQCFGYPANCLEIDIIQMIRLIENGEEVKMSKRTGKAVTLKDLIDDIGVDATRYFLCSRAADSHLDFDLTLAKSQTSDNPVYYAQYAHARMISILKTAPEFNKQEQYNLLKEEKELDLLKTINEFPNEVAIAAKSRSPHKICNYIQKLSSQFHSFYSACKVVDVNNKELTNERVALVKATEITLKNALNTIGVSAPDQM